MTTEEKQSAVKAFVRSTKFKAIVSVESKKEIATFAHVVATEGYPSHGGRRGRQPAIASLVPQPVSEETVSARGFLLTLNCSTPEHLHDCYASQAYADIDMSAEDLKETAGDA